MHQSEHWRIGGEATLSLRDWDGECAVYNPLSGNTHILDVVSGKLLCSIVEGHHSAETLRARIAQFLEVPNDRRMAEHVNRILVALDELGLIEPVPGC
jgi:PqqD family protein of HPr-rel-A system